MHVVTFYSYKGGVGRTMALVNSAAALAKRGRKVLIVDFDLEAPGISTYPPFASLNYAKGVVEYVTEYVETSVASKASDFIVECTLGDSSVWAMPAGLRDREYSSRLNAIDWQRLYAVQRGYLFFEDLKQQWKDQKFDYVLVDSRTGHTDVGGICTRQLPDAVVLMFFPNDQNLIGLESVVKDIREETSAPKEKGIQLHFCASNVPDLDDEEHILENKLTEAKTRLSYDASPVLIHHYSSLKLLEQSIFIVDRPASKLATEYGALVKAIVSRNLEDREGALAALSELRDETRMRTRKGQDASPMVRETLNSIRDHHPNDGEIAWNMAHIYNLLGDLKNETDRLTVAIEQKAPTATNARRRRATIARLQGRQEDAFSDLQEIVSNPETPGVEFVAALELLREIDGNWISFIFHSPQLKRLNVDQLSRLGEILMSEPKGNELVVSLWENVTKEISRNDKRYDALSFRLILAYISSGQFKAAIDQFALSHDEVLRSEDIQIVFNYAMAEWGASGSAPRDLMARVIQLASNDPYRDVNRYQCFALAQHICGDATAAQQMLDQAKLETEHMRGRRFSCWRYLEVTQVQMREDLSAMELFFEETGPGPRVFSRELDGSTGGLLN